MMVYSYGTAFSVVPTEIVTCVMVVDAMEAHAFDK